MIGTFLNALGILAGGIAGLATSRQLSPSTQSAIKGLLGVLTVFVGLRLTWISIGGGFWLAIKQLTIVILSMMLGRLIGRLLHLQKASNRLGQYAKERLSQGIPGGNRLSEGFTTATLLFCVAPISLLGAVQDGLNGSWQTLALKAVLDGLATMAFVAIFGWGVMLCILPVVAYQGTIALAARSVAPLLRDYGLLDSINATGGLLVFCIALIFLELKKVELADYLPSLVVAPALTYFWR